jgi:uncharacterized SAM-binding protein YcdF (DUF218 family)
LIRFVTNLLETPLALRDATPEPRDAIVVLGAPLGPGGRLTQILEERVAAAVMLYRAGAGRHVVASGGITHGGPRAEAEAVADALRAAGIPDVIVEAKSQSTAENARYTAELVAPLGVHTIWIVTQPFHGKRAELLFRKIGFDARAWHIADSVQYRDRTRALKWLVREYGAWAVMRLRRD